MFKRLALGDERALQQIIDRYGDELLARILQIIHRRSWAEEIQMDVFFDLWQQRKKVALMEHPKAWLFKVAYYKTVDYLRKENIKSHFPIEESSELKSINMSNDANDFVELKSIIEAAIEQLPPKEKRVFILRTEEQWSIKKIAATLGRSTSTIKNELIIARKAIRKIVSYYLHVLLF